ncbi:unnamed protein product [Musa textilis]
MHSNRQKKSRTPARSRPPSSLPMWTTHFALDGADALLCPPKSWTLEVSSNGPRAFNSNDNHLPTAPLNSLSRPSPHPNPAPVSGSDRSLPPLLLLPPLLPP